MELFPSVVHRKVPFLEKLVDDTNFSLIDPGAASGVKEAKLVDVNKLKVCNLYGLPAYHEVGLSGAADKVLVRQDVADMLENMAGKLPEGFGVIVWDGWRPLSVQEKLFEDANENTNYVSFPSDDPAVAPPHSTGGAVDISFSYKNTPLSLGTPFDCFATSAHTHSLEKEDAVEKFLRRALFWLMISQGFVNYPYEWWHFEFGTRRWGHFHDVAPLYSRIDEL